MVKRLSISLAAAFALSLPISALAPADAQTSVPMTCEIGTVNAVVIGPNGAFLHFIKSNNAATAGGLQPGQCSFEDRAVLATEPAVLCFPASITAIGFMGNKQYPLKVAFGGPGAAVLQNAVNGPNTASNFMVHQANVPGATTGCFVVDKFGV